MRRPRFTIGRLMTVVTFCAVNFAALRSIFFVPPEIGVNLILGLWVMANVLAVGLLRVGHRARKGRPIRPSAIGFQVAGWTASLAYAALCFAAPRWARSYIEAVVSPYGDAVKFLLRRLNAPSPLPIWLAAPLEFSVIFDLAVPPLLVALLGGWLASRWSALRSRRRPLPHGPMAIPRDHEGHGRQGSSGREVVIPGGIS